MSSSESNSFGPNSPKKKYHRTEGKGSLEESIHNVKPLDLTMARSNHSIDTSTLESSESSVDEVIEVEESETAHEPDNTNEDDSSYEEVESIVEEEVVETDDEDEVMEEAPAESKSDEDTTSKVEQLSLSESTQPESKVVESEAPPSPIQTQPQNSRSTKVSPRKAYENDEDDNNKTLGWEKPEWTKTPVLRNTSKGKVLKEGGTVSAPITKIAEVAAENKDLSFKKPDWTKNIKLKSTGKGDVLKTEGNLAKPITALPHIGKDFEKDEPTMLEKSYTSPVRENSPKKPCPKPSVSAVVGDEDESGVKTIEWEKPEWTKKPVLKETDKGDKLKQGATLSRPIGGIKPVDN